MRAFLAALLLLASCGAGPRAATPDARCTDSCLHMGNQLQAAFDRTQNPIQLAVGTACIRDTLRLDHRTAPTIQGKGQVRSSRDPASGTTILWCGPSDRFAIRALNTRESMLRDLTIEVGYGTPLLGAIDLITDHRAVGYVVPPYAQSFERISITTRYGNPQTALTYGIRHRKGVDKGQVAEYPLQPTYLDAAGRANVDANDWNNSETTGLDLTIMGAKYPLYVDPKNSQAKALRFERVAISCDYSPESAGFGGRPDGTPNTSGVSSLDVRSGNVNRCGFMGDFGGPNDYLTFTNVNSELGGGLLRTNNMWANGNATIRDSRFGFGNSPLFKEGGCLVEYGWQGGLKLEGVLIDVGWRDGKICLNSSPHGSGIIIENSSIRTKSSTPWKVVGGYPVAIFLRLANIGGTPPYGTLFVNTQTQAQ